VLVVSDHQDLAIREDIGGAVPKIDDAPWPQFPADLMSIALIVATQARGTVLIHEKMFESRLYFVDRLIGMGAKIILCDPHRAVIVGPSPLHGQELSSPDIRAGMALLIAALAAHGTSTIANIGQIDRGYQAIDEKLRALGAHIERVDM
jgi:UDP-N-acetylglucosamine 1-carboxyvinyltransferase